MSTTSSKATNLSSPLGASAALRHQSPHVAFMQDFENAPEATEQMKLTDGIDQSC